MSRKFPIQPVLPVNAGFMLALRNPAQGFFSCAAGNFALAANKEDLWNTPKKWLVPVTEHGGHRKSQPDGTGGNGCF